MKEKLPDRKGDPIIWRWLLSSFCLTRPNPFIHHLNSYQRVPSSCFPSFTVAPHTWFLSSCWERTLQLCGRCLLSVNLVTQPHGVTLPRDWWRLKMSHHTATETHWLCHLHWQMYHFIITGNKSRGGLQQLCGCGDDDGDLFLTLRTSLCSDYREQLNETHHTTFVDYSLSTH